MSGSNEVQYAVNEWVSAPEHNSKKGYHLFVFDSIESAIRFKECTAGWKIYECRIKSTRKIPQALMEYLMEIVPTGIVMAKRVKLLKEVI